MIVPVPGSTSSIRWLGVVRVGEDTSSILEIVSFVAGQTVTSAITCCALIRNGDAGFVGVEDPIFGAGKTDLVVPVPCSTSEI